MIFFKSLQKYTILICLITSFLQAQDRGSEVVLDSSFTLYKIDSTTYHAYQKPTAWQHFPNSIYDVADYTKITFSKNNLPKLGWVAASTALLLVYDQNIVDEAQHFGRRIGLDGSNNLKTVGKIFGLFPVEVPTDFSSALYFIGDGWTDTAIITSFFTFGMITDDVRALQTSSQLAEGILATTVVTQILKHITGRQSPFKSTEPGGKWEFFPNQVKYHKNVPAYDAYPSGHLAAGIVVLEVIAENYKEYRLIRPFGYTLLTALSFQMLNNGVHWASDYPLSLLMGYTIADLVLKRGRKVLKSNDKKPGFFNNIKLGFGTGSQNQFTLNLSYSLD